RRPAGRRSRAGRSRRTSFPIRKRSAPDPTGKRPLARSSWRSMAAIAVSPPRVVYRLAPNWFALVMGTGIIPNAAMLLPAHRGGGRGVSGGGLGLLAGGGLTLLATGALAQWVAHPERARSPLADPAVAPFYGAPPMALLTVGSGALLAGHRIIGAEAALHVDA